MPKTYKKLKNTGKGLLGKALMAPAVAINNAIGPMAIRHRNKMEADKSARKKMRDEAKMKKLAEKARKPKRKGIELFQTINTSDYKKDGLTYKKK